MRRLAAIAFSLAALGALASPVGVQAELSDWEHEGAPLESSASVPLKGQFHLPGATSCSGAEATIVLNPGSTGEITSLRVPTPLETCEVAQLLKANDCTQVSGITAENLPWLLHDTGSEIRATNVKTTVHFKGGIFCPKWFTASGEAVLVPDDPESIASFTLGGVLTTSFGTSITLSGTLAPTTAGDEGTYGL